MKDIPCGEFQGQLVLNERNMAVANNQAATTNNFMTQSTTETMPPAITDAIPHQPEQPWHASLGTDQPLTNLYRGTTHEARSEQIAKIEAGVQIEDLQAVVTE